MAFPHRAIAITAVAALFLYLFDFPFRPAVGLCIVTFLVTGRAYLRLFVTTFPRDLWYVRLPLSVSLYMVPARSQDGEEPRSDAALLLDVQEKQESLIRSL